MLSCIFFINEQIILHPFEMPSPVMSFLLGGGPVLFLAAQGWYLMAVPKVRPRLYVICIFLMIFLSVGACFFPAWISLIIIGLLLTVLSILESL